VKKANLCVTGTCLNGATCIQSGNTVFCQCASGYSGQFCQTGSATNLCATNPWFKLVYFCYYWFKFILNFFFIL
jgi:hypothetical protein